MTIIYTAGYLAWRRHDLFEQTLALNAILMDIRFSPWSRNPDWTQAALREVFGPAYFPMRELGNENYRTPAAPFKLWKPEEALPTVAAFLETTPVLLLCACRDVHQCHRKVAAEWLAERTGAEVVHLEPPVGEGGQGDEVAGLQGSPCEIRGLTLHRPWDYAITHLGKPIENRAWAPPAWLIGGYLALHAGKTWDQAGARWIACLMAAQGSEALLTPDEHQGGAIVGVARLVGTLGKDASGAVTVLAGGDGMMEHASSPWFFGPVGWVLEGVVAIERVPCRGAQRLWMLPLEVLVRVRAGYGAARAVA